MAIKVNIPNSDNLPPLSTQMPICNKPIIILTQVETRIYPNGTTFTRSWVVGNAKEINSENKRKPAEKKVMDNFTTTTDTEEL